MAKQPTQLAVQQPLLEADKTASQHFRTWLNEVSAYVPIVGSGSPEGAVEARQYAQYIDEANPQVPVRYIKMLAEVNGDRKKGWISALALDALVVNGAVDITGDVGVGGDTDIDGSLIVGNELESETGRIIVNPGSGEGIRFADADDFGWADITAPISVRGVAATDPSWTQIGSGPMSAFAFGLGDYVWQPFHVPHDIVPGADIHFHVHWLPSGTNTNTVKWEFNYMYAKGFDQAAFDPDGASVTVEQAGPGVAYQHMVAETDGVTISGLDEPDGIIYVRLGRVTNGGTNNTDTIYVLTADIHYQSTGLIATKNRSPNFYT